jgi:hypothetical protein
MKARKKPRLWTSIQRALSARDRAEMAAMEGLLSSIESPRRKRARRATGRPGANGRADK